MGGFGGQAGLTRLFNGEIGGQISWLLPAALILLVAGLWFTRRAPRTDRVRAALLLWGGWTLVTALVFSLMEGTFHAYYTVALAPGDRRAGGAIGGREAWRVRDTWTGRGVLAGDHGGHRRLGLGAARPLDDVPALAALGRARGRRRRRDRAAGPGRMAGAGGHGRRRSGADRRAGRPDGVRGADRPRPRTRAASRRRARAPGAGFGPGGRMRGQRRRRRRTARRRHRPGRGGPAGRRARLSRAEPGGFGMGGPGGEQVGTQLADMLTSAGTRWAAATMGSQGAATMELRTGTAVMAIGGFIGSDPSPTLEQFQAYVANGEIHYFVAGGMGGGPGRGNSEISQWVQQHFTAQTVGSQTVYDLTRPAS